MKENSNLVIPPYHITYLNIKSFDFISSKFDILYSGTFGLDVADIYSFLREKKIKIYFIKKFIKILAQYNYF